MLELLPSEREFVALDLETTGLMADTDRIVEIGAVRFRRTGDEIGRFQCLVNPERRMSPAAYAIHGLSDEDLAHAPTAREVLPDLLEFLGDPATTALLAHNASFDAGFLGRELARAGLPSPTHSLFDTLALARRRLPMAASHRLDHLAQILRLDPAGAHRAWPTACGSRKSGSCLTVPRNPCPRSSPIAFSIPVKQTPPQKAGNRSQRRPPEASWSGSNTTGAPGALAFVRSLLDASSSAGYDLPGRFLPPRFF